MRANLTRKMKIIREYQTERKDRKLIELACTQLNRPSDQLIDNHGEFQALCDDHEELQEAGTWLLESQELVKELMCKTVLQSVLSKSAMMPSPPKPLIEILARGQNTTKLEEVSS